MMINIKDYIANYNFTKDFHDIKIDLEEEKCKKFSSEFWKNPNVDLNKLKAKYDIPIYIAFADILKQHPTEEYKNLIKECWSEKVDISNLIEKYGIKLQRLEQIIFPITFSDEDCVCPGCLSNYTYSISKNIKHSTLEIHCKKCNQFIDECISKKEAELKKKKIDEEKIAFKAIVDNINIKLKEIKCPKCQGRMELFVDNIHLKFRIDCSVCECSYDNYGKLLKDYEAWKQRAAMMIKIKAKEDELIKEFLNKKSSEAIKVKSEELILREESLDSIAYLMNKNYSNNSEAFSDLFKYIKTCNRLEKKLLIEICMLGNETQPKYSKWTDKENDDAYLKVRVISQEEPLVAFLLSKTKIIIIRKTLRGLIKKNLVYCCEKENEIHIHESLIENLEKLKNLLKPQRVASELAHLIFYKQKYMCYHCGEDGRPLKVAYLSADKDTNDLSYMIGICDLCYDNVTDNEVLIDLMISSEEEEENEQSLSWKFLIKNCPDFKDNNKAYIANQELLVEYDEADIIKAYAATIDKFVKGNKKGNFFAYVRGILNYSEDGVNISKQITKEFEVEKWINDLN